MQKSLLVSFVLVVMVACGGSDTPSVRKLPPPPPPLLTASEQLREDLQGLSLDEFYVESFGALLKRTPESVVTQTLEDVYPLDGAGLNNYSDSYQRETFAMYQIVLDALRSYDRNSLDADGQLNYDAYEWFLQDEVDFLPFIYNDFPATYSFGVPRRTQRFFVDLHPLATAQDAEDYISRMSAVQGKFAQLATHLGLQQQNGIVEPALSIQVAINQYAPLGQGVPFDHPFYQNFRTKLESIDGLTDAERNDLDSRARTTVGNSVIPGYAQLANTLQNLLNSAPPSIGVGQYSNGAAYYARALRHHTTTDLTAAEIHQLGLDELTRIHAEMRLIFDQLGYPQNETLQELFARVATDGGIIPAANVRSTYEAIIADAEPRLDAAFDIFPAADVVVEPDPFGGFYIGPSFDGSRPGAFYAGTENDEAYYQMPSLTYHESIPGHHTQIALAMEQDSDIFRKIFRSTAFVEGWALYAERLAWELGWYDGDPYGNLGRLQYEALRAARLVMDTGIHEFGWSFDEATQFNIDNVGWSLGASQSAAARYSVWPGQATAYMVGLLKILDERQRAMDELGTDFDLKGFHRALLENGGLPLELMDDVVDRYIAEVQAAN
ncbi:MAG: DUF885 domain-containing protein [Pseudomonadota bacterium]